MRLKSSKQKYQQILSKISYTIDSRLHLIRTPDNLANRFIRTNMLRIEYYKTTSKTFVNNSHKGEFKYPMTLIEGGVL